MIEPTERDIGRAVIYQPRGCEPESGLISSYNDVYVFVRYGISPSGVATSREDLRWLFNPSKLEAPSDPPK